MADEGGRFEVRVTSDSHFSWIRTRLAIERTLLAWIRTGTALIGFGFTIVQFFERLAQMQGVEPALRPQMPRYLGLALIGAGIVALAVAMREYRKLVTYLWSKPFEPIAGIREAAAATPAIFVAMLITLIGVFAFGAVFLRFL